MDDTKLTFNDVLIVPRYSEVLSRKDVDLKQVILPEHPYGLKLDIPICSSNMDTITDIDMAIAMRELGGIGFLHRNMTIEETVDAYDTIVSSLPEGDPNPVVITIGTSDNEFLRFKSLYDIGCRHFCVDIAHGHSLMVKNMVSRIISYSSFAYNEHENSNPVPLIIAGNVVTLDAIYDYKAWGINISKVGIGAGHVCTTRIKTGIGYPQISAIKNTNTYRKIITISDGGIKSPGDACKVIAAGASLVMIGGILAGTEETPGEVILHNGKQTKAFRGMASESVNIDMFGSMSDYKTSEGISCEVPFKGPVKNIINDIVGGLRSACSYVGAKNLDEFRLRAELIKVSDSSYKEGLPVF